MPTNRKVVFANGEFYHIFNSGVERRTVCMNKREYQRSTDTMQYYQYRQIPKKINTVCGNKEEV